MKNYLHLLVLCLAMFACKGKKTDAADENSLPAALSNAYPKLKLPFFVVDSTINSKAGNATIAKDTFTQYFSDTIFKYPFADERSFQLYPIGKILQPGKESYFLTLAKGKSLSAIYLSVYDSNRHMTTLPLLTSEKDTAKSRVNTASIDKKLTVVLNKEWTIKNVAYYNRIIYAYNNVGVFTTVLTETNEQRTTQAVVSNPLDTFPRRNKFSGDYTKGTGNYLFIRDGGSANDYLFFVHFKGGSSEDPCGGELRGRMKMADASTGRYAENGDPCGVDFVFKGNDVQVKENGSCGNYRDIKCFFNDTYTKKKEAGKPAVSHRKKH